MAGHPNVDPFVLTRRGFERSRRAFAPKFQSIRRDYRVLFGEDVLAGLKVDPALERFLCEQALRNLRLRLAYSFITRARHKKYDRFLVAHVTPIFVQLSAAVRLQGVELPKDFDQRISGLARELGIDGLVLRDLLNLKARANGNSLRLTEEEIIAWHWRVFPVVDRTVEWVEQHWPD